MDGFGLLALAPDEVLVDFPEDGGCIPCGRMTKPTTPSAPSLRPARGAE